VAFVRADEFQFDFLLLSSSSVFQLGSGYGQKIFIRRGGPQYRKALSLVVSIFTPPRKEILLIEN
jgi:hypothetical protein